jgi:predicted MPP superfamily phosphohydrolase
VDDPATGRDDVSRAMHGVPPGTCCLLLAHSPDIVLRLGPYRPGLILAGHTHGGQIRLPLIGPVITMSKVPRQLTMGLHQYAGVPTFVTRGIGYSGLNLRLGCPAEVALLTLRSPLAAERAA